MYKFCHVFDYDYYYYVLKEFQSTKLIIIIKKKEQAHKQKTMIDYIKILPFSIELNNVWYEKRVEVNFVMFSITSTTTFSKSFRVKKIIIIIVIIIIKKEQANKQKK